MATQKEMKSAAIFNVLTSALLIAQKMYEAEPESEEELRKFNSIPSEPGYYWFRDGCQYMHEDVLFVFSDGSMSGKADTPYEGTWWGPLVPPWKGEKI